MAPLFPPIAIASNTSGSVVVEVKVNAAGNAISAQIIDGNPLLRQVRGFEETAKRWRFAAAEKGERAARLTFVCRIMPKETTAENLTPVFTLPYQVEVKHRPYESVVDSDPPSNISPSKKQRGGKPR